MAKVINTVLNLKNNMSKGLLKVSKDTRNMTSEMRTATRQAQHMSNKISKSIKNIVNKASSLGKVGISIAGAFAVKTGFGEAMNMEGFRTQLETATKSAKKAGEIMAWSVNLANKTPFETGSVVEASAKLEAMGISAKKNLTMIADMAGATNKPLDQAVEAFIDAQTGELERLKEFGIKKADIAKKAGEMFRNQEVINNKGQIVDQKKFNEALMKIMEERYKGGANKLANTTKGLWSTVTGVTKNALANIVGITNEGTIKQGSALDFLKQKIKLVADKLQQWQKDGTIQKVAKKFTQGLQFIFNAISKVINFMIKHKTAITNFAIVFGSFIVAINIIKTLTTVISALNLVFMLLNGTISLTPIGWLVIGLTTLIAIGILLWKNWDVVKTKGLELWNSIVATWSGIKTSVVNSATEMWNGLKSTWSGIKTGFSNMWTGIKTSGINAINGIIDTINNFIKKINNLPFIDIPSIKNIPIPKAKKTPRHALGTSYWRGGLTGFSESGRQESAILPNGTQIIPADKSKKLIENTSKDNSNLIINIYGNIYGEEDLINKVGCAIQKKVGLAYANL